MSEERQKTKKKKVELCRLNKQFPQIVDSYIESGLPFTLGLGKYSSYIQLKNSNRKLKFITRLQSKKTFIAYAKILKDCNRPEVEAIIMDLEDSVEEKNNMYFSLGNIIPLELNHAVCVDLNSAYLQALVNIGLVTEKTQQWINTNLTKEERLVAVGLLAKRKEIIEFSGGEILESKIDESKKRFIFNTAVQEVNRVMLDLKSHFIDDFICYWVDGMYLKNEFIAFLIQDEFNKKGFPCSVDFLTDFKAENRLTDMFYSYRKDGKRKTLCIPIENVMKNIKKRTITHVNRLRLKKGLGNVDEMFFYKEEKSFVQSNLF